MMVIALDANSELLSATRTVTADSPSAVGVPVIAPPGASARPSGRAPSVTDQVYGPSPPSAVRVAEYSVPTVPPGRDTVVIARAVEPSVVDVFAAPPQVSVNCQYAVFPATGDS